MIRPPPRSTLFPSPTLFGSGLGDHHPAIGMTDEDHRLVLGCNDLLRGGHVAGQRLCRVLNDADVIRSEVHTSELQSRQYIVCRLLLEKKKNSLNSTHPNLSL